MTWIYVLGERTGYDIKIGHAKSATVIERMAGINGEANDHTYVLLAAMRSQVQGERDAKNYFAHLKQPKGSRQEYFRPAPELVEWILWLRQEWFVSFSPHDQHDEQADVAYDAWIPKAHRRVPRPPRDDAQLVQPGEQLRGELAGTAWSWMPDMEASFQDYFTPPELIAQAIVAMGGLDGDVASHWVAVKRLRAAGVVIPEYLHINRSAFEYDWFERSWLNPPYGDNQPWFRRAIEMMDTGTTRQLCMLSPLWAFATQQASEIMQRSAATVILTPTPKFYNPSNPTKDGSNHPHAIVYWGDRRDEFVDAFDAYGSAWERARARTRA